MKRWMIENLTGLAGVFGWKIPHWTVRGLPEQELEAIRRSEDDLTGALRSGNPRSHDMPDFLEARIERAIEDAERPVETLDWKSLILLPATAVAAILLLALFLSQAVQDPPTGGPGFKLERAVAAEVEPSSVGTSLERVVNRMTDIKRSARAESLLVEPLAEEPARLASDVTSAIRIVAQSILPQSYLNAVNRNLDSLEAEVGNPI